MDRVTATRHAQALLELAIEQDKTSDWGTALQQLAEAYSDTKTKAFLLNPGIAKDTKEKVLREGLETLPKQVRNYMLLLIRRNSVQLLPEVVKAYNRLADKHSGVARATVESAFALDDQERDAIAKNLKNLFDIKEVVIDTRVTPELIGGVKIRVGDKQLDGSVTGKLKRLGNALKS